ncbi:hypothetical protein Tcan_09903 [Toxocara canis]|uniref:Uncharacterized protein n=2 Tax=Toxocara canis TaxID=6265 RepID=A0A0B2VGQ2_TOXCA|nr:hypothetical protein Tcan_09903 [Toxocara canis]
MDMTLRVATLTLLATVLTASMTNADIIDDIKEIRVFELKKSSLACPIIVVGEQCPEETPLYYFKCCGDLNGSCCFRLQEWVIVLLIIMGVLIAISFVVNFIRCLFCYGR